MAMRYQSQFQLPFLIAGVLGLLSLGAPVPFGGESALFVRNVPVSKEMFLISGENRGGYLRSFPIAFGAGFHVLCFIDLSQ